MAYRLSDLTEIDPSDIQVSPEAYNPEFWERMSATMRTQSRRVAELEELSAKATAKGLKKLFAV